MRIGLISDTHIPDRCPELPGTLPEIFRGVDLILHAGDVGDVAVLAQLEPIAPVVAVHGNDEPTATKEALPLSQTFDIDGRKLLLTHGDDPDPQIESALRREDHWTLKVDYWRERARSVTADVFVFGHTHVPMAVERDGVLLINPGALASGSFFHRQTGRTVAILEPDGRVRHVDVDRPDRHIDVQPRWDKGFSHALLRFQKPMYDPPVMDAVASGWVREVLSPAASEQLASCLRSLGGECWSGSREWVTTSEFVERLLSDPPSRERLIAALSEYEPLAQFLPVPA